MASDKRAAVPVVWCSECKTGNAPYDDLGCCFKCLCPVEQRHVVTTAERDELTQLRERVEEASQLLRLGRSGLVPTAAIAKALEVLGDGQ